ncbi:MAG: DMT family transporter [Aeropyrum sp.]|nr:DMT family transporter [Aeropyrum sp.]MCE4616940.1 DMT family transporter [Aeropyrum sp.]
MTNPLYLGLLGVAVINVSLASILFRLAAVHGFVAASYRLIFSSALTLMILLLLAATGKHGWPPRLSSWRDIGVMALSGIMLALHFDLWLMSLTHLNVAPSVLIVDSYPAVLALVGWFVFREKYTATQIVGALVAMVGVFAMMMYSSRESLAPPGGDPVLGAVLAFGGMLAVAAYFSIGRGLRSRYSTWEYTLVVYTVAAITSVILTRLLGEPLTGYELRSYIYLLLMALLPMIGGHTIVNFLLGRMSLLASTVPLLGEPVGAALLAWALLGEPIDVVTAVLMALVLVGIWMVVSREA